MQAQVLGTKLFDYTEKATDPGRAKTNFYGALSLHNGKELAMRSDLMNAEISAQYLEMILETNPDVPIILLWDRAP